MNSCSYWAAGHLTAFFKIADESEDILSKGSLGAGFNIQRGVITEVKPSDDKNHRIYFNSEQQPYDITGITNYVINQVQEKLDESLSPLDINHTFEVPIGSGYGSSGSAALSTVFAINSLLDLKIPELILWQIAHKAEIFNKTGLGDILGLYSQSKFEMRTKEGSPGVGEVVALDFDEHEYDLFTYSIGPLSKKYLLTDPVKRHKITEEGEKVIKEFQVDPTFEKFCDLSLTFTKKLNLIPENLWNIIDSLPGSIKVSQIMLGESLFFFVPKKIDITKYVKMNLVKEELVAKTINKVKS